MPAGSHTFWLPRRGNSPDEYEDAFALDEAASRYALADGATEGCFTGLWARLLVEDFVSSGTSDVGRWPDSLAAAQDRWDRDVRGRKLDWDADYWLEQGASATFLGVALAVLSEGECQWQAVAVGDTCLMHTRDNVLQRAFPLERSNQFGNRPQLVGSRTSAEDVRKRLRTWSNGRGQAGDRLWAMTDALAHWCLAEHEAGRDPWGELESLLGSPRPQDRFAPWIEGLRDSGRLDNDDVTLLAVCL